MLHGYRILSQNNKVVDEFEANNPTVVAKLHSSEVADSIEHYLDCDLAEQNRQRW